MRTSLLNTSLQEKHKEPMYQQILITWVKSLVNTMIWLRHDLMVESIERSMTRKRRNLW